MECPFNRLAWELLAIARRAVVDVEGCISQLDSRPY